MRLPNLPRLRQCLKAAGFELDIALGELQRGHRSNEVFPVHGGNRHEGIANLQVTTNRGDNPTETPIFTGSDDYVGDSESLSNSGYNVVHGSSFIMTLSYTDEGQRPKRFSPTHSRGTPIRPTSQIKPLCIGTKRGERFYSNPRPSRQARSPPASSNLPTRNMTSKQKRPLERGRCAGNSTIDWNYPRIFSVWRPLQITPDVMRGHQVKTGRHD